jgi:hypothetical protein
MNRTGSIFLGSFAGLFALVLLYIALFLAPEVYHGYYYNYSAPSKNGPEEATDMTLKVQKFTPE